MTLVSTATKALFLQPTDALHGDLGICSPEDLLLMFDREGEDDQMLGMIPYVKAKGVTIVSITCKPTCKLSRVADHHMHLPLERELCPFNQAPVTSASVQMLFGSTIAVAVCPTDHSLPQRARPAPPATAGDPEGGSPGSPRGSARSPLRKAHAIGPE
mmetsp:Transcript_17438/g.56107  ORF Transcript_17438/g.56107 Transcript_17438/m.56107 type:complete len:158 (-) Transcript_17438:636-1109(-)